MTAEGGDMEPHDQHIRRLISEERIGQLARDYRGASHDASRHGRHDLRGQLAAEAHRGAQSPQLSRG
jgi:hypothetical protein